MSNSNFNTMLALFEQYAKENGYEVSLTKVKQPKTSRTTKRSSQPKAGKAVAKSKTAQPKAEKTPKLYKLIFNAMGIEDGTEKMTKAIDKAKAQYKAAHPSCKPNISASTAAYFVYSQNPKLLGHSEAMEYKALEAHLIAKTK